LYRDIEESTSHSSPAAEDEDSQIRDVGIDKERQGDSVPCSSLVGLSWDEMMTQFLFVDSK
jgi:hypothetical protein